MDIRATTMFSVGLLDLLSDRVIVWAGRLAALINTLVRHFLQPQLFRWPRHSTKQ
jgi:hypothetical protein